MSLFAISNTKVFDKLLEKVTSPLLLEIDWEGILQLCDIVKSQDVPAKHAVQSIKKKFGNENAHVILSSLQCLESIVKNCGGTVHKEVAQKDVIDALRELAKNGPDLIRDKILELIQCWSHGLGQQHRIFTDTYNQMKMENYQFPPLKESEAMFENNDVAPEWRDDKECFRCHQTFTTFNRKHHCRACGDIFCDKCSSKQCPIPKFGMDKDVRVCDACYEKLTSGSIPIVNPISKPITMQRPTTTMNPTKTQAEIDEEESFQLALAISQSEADEKERQKKLLTQKYAISSFVSQSATTHPSNTFDNTIEYNELNKYIERGRQEQQLQQDRPAVSNGYSTELNIPLPSESNNFITDNEVDQFTAVVNDHINNFKFRMLSNQQRNRNITNDTAVQSVFVMLQHFYPELNRFMQLLEDKRSHYENLQDKLNQLKDAREALNALRSEHYERKQRETMERERQRQIQLAQKLELMRQKKQEYLEYQRQLHLQRLAQQELEMKNRLEQQRQLAFAREQYTQNPQITIPTYDYGQVPVPNHVYQSPYNPPASQPLIDPNTQYSMIPSYLPATGHYPSMMNYPTKTDINVVPAAPVQMSYPNGTNGDISNNNYSHSTGQLPIANVNMPYTQQPTNPIVQEEQPEPQLISFD